MTMLVAMLFAVVVTFLISACHHTSWDFLRGRTRLSLRVQEKIWPVHGLWWWLVRWGWHGILGLQLPGFFISWGKGQLPGDLESFLIGTWAVITESKNNASQPLLQASQWSKKKISTVLCWYQYHIWQKIAFWESDKIHCARQKNGPSKTSAS